MKIKKKTWLIILAAAAVLTALAFLAILILWQLGILPEDSTEAALFVPGYGFFAVPIIGLAAGVFLQILTVRSPKKKKADAAKRTAR